MRKRRRLAAQSGVPITTTATASNVSTAQGSVAQSRGAIDQAQKELEAARARLTTAQARVREAEANAAKAARDVERLRGLLAKDEISQQLFDTTVAAADAQRAGGRFREVAGGRSRGGDSRRGEQAGAGTRRRTAGAGRPARRRRPGRNRLPPFAPAPRPPSARAQQAKASLDQAELNLQYTVIKAPTKGIVSRKSVEVGQVIQPGQPLMALIPLDTVWITANFKETQLRDMHPGQPVTIQVDAYGGRDLKGKVDSIAAATGARFSLLPPENATGNYVKVVQRVPVKIVLEAGQDPDRILRPGMSVVPTVYTK